MKTTKAKLKHWALSKNLTDCEVNRILELDSKAGAHRLSRIFLVNGRVVPIEDVYRHKHRKSRRTKIISPKFASAMAAQQARPLNVIMLPLASRVRPEAALNVIGKVEAVLREAQRLLVIAKDNSLCRPGKTTFLWPESCGEDENVVEIFRRLVTEGVKAFYEQDYVWAGLCWQSALLMLERLIHTSSLDAWTTLFKCCMLLYHSGAAEFLAKFLDKLRSFQEWSSLPLQALHRPLVIAICQLSNKEFVEGMLFVFQAKVELVKTIWPNCPAAYTNYEIDLAEQQRNNGIDIKSGELLCLEMEPNLGS